MSNPLLAAAIDRLLEGADIGRAGGTQPTVLLMENRVGHIRLGYGTSTAAPLFVVDADLAPGPTGTRVSLTTVHTTPRPAPIPGLVGGAELDALLDRLRATVALMS